MQDPINSRLISKIPMIRSRISALAPSYTGQLLNYSLLISDLLPQSPCVISSPGNCLNEGWEWGMHRANMSVPYN